MFTEDTYNYLMDLATSNRNRNLATLLHLQHQRSLLPMLRVLDDREYDDETIDTQTKILQATIAIEDDAISELQKLQPTKKPDFHG